MKKVFGCTGSYPEYYIAKNIDQKTVVVIKDKKRAQLFYNDLKGYLKHFGKSTPVVYIPSENSPSDTESQIKRNHAIYKILRSDRIFVIVEEEALKLSVRNKDSFKSSVIIIKREDEVNRDFVIEKLFENGFIRVDNAENEGEFSVKGGYIKIFLPFTGIVGIDLFGDFVENIFLFSVLGTKKSIEKVEIFPLYDFPVENTFPISLKESKKGNISDYLEGFFKVYIDSYTKGGDLYLYTFGDNKEVADPSTARKVIKIPIKQPLYLKTGEAFVPEEREVLHLDFDPIKEGDYIVHEDFGIGIYRGIETRNIKGKNYDFMILEYADGEKVYVSYLHLNKIFKYKTDGTVKLDKLGGTSWKNLKKRVKSSLKKVARELIELYSYRMSAKRDPFNTEDEILFEFEKSFPFVETPDQDRAIKDIKKDMSSSRPMDRVICGDVGFGKTEVALRAAFIAVLNGKQVAVLTPTTILSYQHYKNFKNRLEPFGIRVENLSRLKSKKEQEKVINLIKKGDVDVIVGTHRLLQEDIKFKDLGLLIIDEEHRFGVRAKEKIRQIKKDLDTLYLTATPIPRTLNMALSGFKDISVIKTPPEGRIETKTFVTLFDEEVIKKAVNLELSRNGQVFYLHNRIQTIQERAEYIKKLFPDAKVSVAHGKMKPKQLEKVILDFMEKRTDILVSTSIIETGIDVPTANTLIVERADLFGLAQLYHLRGRVGRGNLQAYCYLLLPEKITEDAQKRIDALLRFTRPGSGLKISIEDMNIRGAGNILGVEQSGYIKSVGYEMYIKLLQEVLQEEKGEKEKDITVNIDFDSYIPDSFIKDPAERMNLYMIVSKAVDSGEIEKIRKHLREFYSGLPEAFDFYLQIEKLKRALKSKGISKIDIKKSSAVLYFDSENSPDPDILDRLLKESPVRHVYSDRLEMGFSKEDIEKLVNIFQLSYSTISS